MARDVSAAVRDAYAPGSWPCGSLSLACPYSLLIKAEGVGNNRRFLLREHIIAIEARQKSRGSPYDDLDA